ncbi:hypothetical protein UNDKW_0733 [Undibacterium sp. KW1]|uniref:DUF429 domain-containing protein n=1 Tax=Undibacterium sp. KW1 TaxID=2058624 RepID=UPI001331F266|nr:DUF429 domain-containing protein [Undibacterium sp. KW1]BBB59006.1 hypothetical protein UNDKW_0733 [Undibacterium sp. KW1]
MKLHGVDFTSAPSRRKGITIASGQMQDGVLRLESLQTLSDFTVFDNWLMQGGPWLAGFDLPFSLPRELVEHLRWPANWPDLMRHLQTQTRAELRLQFKAFCDARPSGNKFAHRATDIPAGSSPSMKWVNPPVAYMLHAGAPRLLDAGVSIPGMYEGDPQRIALEAYPGMVARSITKASYKSDDKSKQTPERQQARELIVTALEAGNTPWKIKLDFGCYKTKLIADGSADLLDAVLCMLLAAWAWQRRDQNYGLPEFDVLEGWIVGA